MSTWNGKSQANVIGYQILYYIMKYAGIGTVYFILRFVALHFLIFSRYASQSQWYYFRKRLNFCISKSIFSMYQNYYLFGQTLVDRVYMISGMGKNFTFNFDGEEHNLVVFYGFVYFINMIKVIVIDYNQLYMGFALYTI